MLMSPTVSGLQQAAHHTAQQTAMFVAAPVRPTGIVFREMPVAMQCPYCNASITTSTSYETGALTWIIAGVLLLFG